jgi:hydrogenase-4 component F
VVVAIASLAVHDLKRMRLIGALGGIAQLVATGFIAIPVLCGGHQPRFWGMFEVDGIAAWFISVNALVFAGSMVTAALLLADPKDVHLTDRTGRALLGLSALFVVAGNAVLCSTDLGILWVAMEASTLVTAPMILLSGTRKAIEATWKYLILCGVGIAFALLGTMMLMGSAQKVGNDAGTLSIAWLTTHAVSLNGPLLRASFVFFLLGYGTKAGLFPVHNWLPDAHSEAPAPASALLSGALLNCGMVALWRVGGIVQASPSRFLLFGLMVPMGALSVLAACLMLVQQRNLKRMFAYSSVENMGLLAVAVGLRAAPIFALQALAHSLAKASAFNLSGSVAREFGTVTLNKLTGVLRRSPALGFGLLASGAAVMGAPPFISFSSEWLLLAKAADAGQIVVVVALVVGLAIGFVAVMIHLGRVAYGEKLDAKGKTWSALPLVPAMVLLALAVLVSFVVTPQALAGLDSALRAGGSR